MVKIKFCGLRTLHDVELINQYRPDYAGFILAPSKRRIDKETLKALTSHLHPKIKKVGVFVNENPQLIQEYFEEGLIDIAQLHGQETVTYVDELGEKGIPLWKAIRVKNKDIIDQLPPYKVEAYVFDAFSANDLGGTGKSFNYQWLEGYQQTIPYFIAGGLTAENIAAVITLEQPYGIDVSTGIEGEQGKSEAKINKFLSALDENKGEDKNE